VLLSSLETLWVPLSCYAGVMRREPREHAGRTDPPCRSPEGRQLASVEGWLPAEVSVKHPRSWLDWMGAHEVD
jgi:hypothetical protein